MESGLHLTNYDISCRRLDSTVCVTAAEAECQPFRRCRATVPSQCLQFPDQPHVNQVCDTVGLTYIFNLGTEIACVESSHFHFGSANSPPKNAICFLDRRGEQIFFFWSLDPLATADEVSVLLGVVRVWPQSNGSKRENGKRWETCIKWTRQ